MMFGFWATVNNEWTIKEINKSKRMMVAVAGFLNKEF
jgi:hypothetical protein